MPCVSKDAVDGLVTNVRRAVWRHVYTREGGSSRGSAAEAAPTRPRERVPRASRRTEASIGPRYPPRRLTAPPKQDGREIFIDDRNFRTLVVLVGAIVCNRSLLSYRRRYTDQHTRVYRDQTERVTSQGSDHTNSNTHVLCTVRGLSSSSRGTPFKSKGAKASTTQPLPHLSLPPRLSAAGGCGLTRGWA